MTRPEDAPNPGLATAAVEDQPAEAAEQAAEPAVCSEAEPGAAGEPQADAAPAKIDSEGPSPKVKSPSAKVKPSEPVQSEERPSGRRERKQTAFFQPEKKTETEKLEIKEGKGTKLGEMPNVAFHLGKTTGRDELLEDLHQILYGRKGKLATRKKEIQAFSGFIFTDDQQEAELEKAKGLLARFKNDHMTRLLDLLDIPRSDLKDKDARIDKVLDFLKAPSQLSDKDLAAKEAAKKAAGARKRQRKTEEKKEKGSKSADAKPKKAKKAKKNDASETNEGEEEEGEDAGVADQGEEEDEEDDEKPLQAMVPSKQSLPSDKELAQEVVSVLSGVNVLEFNIKMLMKHLNGKYKVDLKEKKPLIKTVAIQYCTEHAPKSNEAEEQ